MSKPAPKRSASGSAARKPSARAVQPSPDDALSELERDRLLAPLAAFPAAVVAVSGGIDSMALLMLVADWLQRQVKRPAILVATVDHQLRAQSADDAGQVRVAATRFGLPHVTLTWHGTKPMAGIQVAAREARYRLLGDAARLLCPTGPVALVTAHTADDQAETVLMRLARGTGLDGLAGMAPIRALDADRRIQLLRPLLGIRRPSLAASLAEAGVTAIEDPSNSDPRFERTGWRNARAALEGLGLTADRVNVTSRRIARARVALEAATDALTRAVQLDGHCGAYATLDRLILLDAPAELQVRLLDRLIEAYGGQNRPIRLARLETLVAAVSRHRFSGQTLGGCVVEAVRDRLRIRREPAVEGLGPLAIVAGTPIRWDGRFLIELLAPELDGAAIRAFGRTAAIAWRKRIASADPLRIDILATLPALWHRGSLRAAPRLAADGLSLVATEAPGHGVCTVRFDAKRVQTS